MVAEMQDAQVPTLMTERLTLLPLRIEDAPAIQERFPRWEVVRYLLARVPWPYPPDGALTYLGDIALPAMRAGREWHWTIRLRAAPEELLGIVSMKDDAADNRGFWLVPETQGRGLMTEACTGVTDFWFDSLRRPLLRVTKAVPNECSRALSRRMGMRLAGHKDADYVGGRYPTEIWEITAEEWREFRTRGAEPSGPMRKT